ncbi:hypothetical protein SRABI106_04361 [Rahnella aquatilis]|nr:hypothetical protein SRABI106_04361 [Rahnella aquatilis]
MMQRQSFITLRTGADSQHTEIMCQKFFHNQAALSRMMTFFKVCKLDIWRRAVQQMQRLRKRDQRTTQFLWQQFGDRYGVEQFKCLIRQFTQGRLADTFRCRINRRQ